MTELVAGRQRRAAASPRSIATGMAIAVALSAGGATAAEAPIVIGASVSETGPLAVDAGYHLRGLQLGVADANAHGGWLGRQIELKTYDDKSEAGTAVRLYTRLLTEDKVDLVIGPYSSGITQAVTSRSLRLYQFATLREETARLRCVICTPFGALVVPEV